VKDNPIENQVLYVLDLISEESTIEVNLKKLLLVYKTVEELVSFFHQPDHYQSINEVREYMGDKKAGMYSLLSRIYHEEFDTMLSQAIKDIVESDDFQSPIEQYYKAK
jgi:hypothetical protein